MSIRLNVVLSQSAGGPPQRGDLESEVVARLIGAPGIDLSLIGPLESLAENSTDRLMLERLSGDLALLSWESPAAAAERLAASQIPGRRAPHPLDPDATAANGQSAAAPGSEGSQRRIYHHPLDGHSAAALQSAIERLLASRRVVTFQLAPAATPPRTPPARVKPPAQAAPPAHAAPPAKATQPARAAPPAQASATDRWDALVDELNDSNI